MNTQIDLSVVIPTYRSAAHIQPLLLRLLPILGGIQAASEVIFVDDGSEPESLSLLRHSISAASGADALFSEAESETGAPHPPVLRAVLLQPNAGQQQATLCGICHATGRTVVTMDDDLQHRPEDIPRLLEALRAGPALVYGVPAKGPARPLRRAGSRARDLIFRIAFGRRAAGVRPTSFRAFHRELIEGLCRDPRGFLYLSAEFFRAGAEPLHLSVDYAPSPAHPARYPLPKLLRVFAGLTLYIPVFPRFLRLLFGGAKWKVAERINFDGPSGSTAGKGRSQSGRSRVGG
ncbi:MAG: glycosyltransferase family 2 protein [Spirochaetaceae bacterium]|nr:glycosyltransferase family 2 protein [Spirochaetaceae bacterium]MCF7947142.1 glycosyltransferase family 2 protein [Spirochaetia bacterium]MCF7950007.1 glycosyltransferase family 2 protein [Spirochaetaceae bacterium]